ncbi:carboxylesterase 5A-like [Rhopilema esculentum]|uniref:carboxylesterase 5A-like n=1 Tax=Rhopilema esculentum TaxID=499914 RepID=UPI0031D89F50|eukprot:gene11313-21503_t
MAALHTFSAIAVILIIIDAAKCIDVNITGAGVVRGTSRTLEGRVVDTFTGIPYAKPPTGNLRFKAPEKAKAWEGVRNSTSTIYCPQKSILSSDIFGNEDCLYLNVYRPRNSPGTNVSVMVWIHGGSYRYGAGGIYDGEMLAAANNVVVVTVNYRLGLLGFFYVPGTQTKGNYGLRDQILALQWVQSHIQSFGGDPKQVTIFGESAGSGSVTLLMLSPLAKGLFKRVIAQSGVPSNYWAVQRPQNNSLARKIGETLHCNNTNNLTSCMRGKSWQELMKVQVKLFEAHPCVTPTVDGVVITEYPPDQMKNDTLHASGVELLLGFNKDEGSMFIPSLTKWDESVYRGLLHERIQWQYEMSTGLVVDMAAFEYTHFEQKIAWLKYVLSINDFINDFDFKIGISNFADAWAKTGAKTYLYHFTHMPKYARVPTWGVAHAIEIDFIFGKALYSIADPKRYSGTLVANFTSEERNISRTMMGMWTDFAKTGIPANTWPTYNGIKMEYLEIQEKTMVKSNFGPKKMHFWNKYVPGMMKRVNEKTCPTLKPVVCTTASPSITSTTTKKVVNRSSKNEHAFVFIYIFAAAFLFAL